MDDVTVYIEDIDTACLKKDNLNKIVEYYSAQSGRDLLITNRYHLVIGDFFHTNLPDNSFDRIYTNATMHVFQSPDSILTDISRKLKPDGMLFIRDGFKDNKEEKRFCPDPKCGSPLLTVNEFLVIMKRNGFKLVRQSIRSWNLSCIWLLANEVEVK